MSFTASSSTTNDRRTFPRIQLRLPVRYRLEGRPEWQTGTARDVSAAGILFATQELVEVSSGLTLLFQVPGETNPRQIHSVVTRTEIEEGGSSYLIGVKYSELNDADRQLIAAALQNSDVIALLRQAAESGASDVHLSAYHPPLIRLAGKLQPLRPEPLAGGDLKHMIYTLMDARQRQMFERNLDLNFSLSIEPTVRYRVNVHHQRGNVEAAFRRIEAAVRTVADLHLPDIVTQLTELRDGLVLIAGPIGSGKTTTAAAMVNQINTARSAVVITLEHPIEYVHAYKQSVIKQREIGVDTTSFPSGLREATHQDPDVIVVGDARDDDTMRTALQVSQMGHLVIATLTAIDCRQALVRVAQVGPGERQAELLEQLAGTLRAVVYQRLLPRADGQGMVPATEVLVNTPAIAQLIRGGAIDQIPSVIETSADQGTHSLASSLERLQKAGLITEAVYRQHRA